MHIWYGPFARLADWYNGVRDGLAGIPDRPPAPRPADGEDDGRPEALRAVPRWRAVTTAHREYLIRMAQDAFAKEVIWYEAGRAAAHQRLVAARTELAAAEEALTDAATGVTRAERPLTEEQATYRYVTESRHSERLIRRRRWREWQRRLDAARKAHETAVTRLHRARQAVSIAEQEATTHEDVAKARILRIHEHFERRIAGYRRPLVRLHPDGGWVNHVIGVNDPSIPGWIPNGIVPDGLRQQTPIDDAEHDQMPLDPILLADVTSMGGAEQVKDEEGRYRHIHVDYFRAKDRHLELRRRADGYDLVVHFDEHGPYIDDRQVRGTTRLGHGSSFEFAGFLFELKMTDNGAWLIRQPLRPSDLIVHDMSAKTGKQTRLSHMSVVQRSGTVMAILGPSGAGKTSLFYALMRELTPHEGTFFYGKWDVSRHAERFRDELGFVPQNDDMYGTLTVRWALTYSDRLNGGRRADRSQRIAAVLDKLRVLDRSDRLVNTLSGGQKKRVSVAMELLRAPKLLMLDEPTSGLDAGLDREVMRLLSAYAAGQKGDGTDRALVIVITHSTNYLGYAQQLLVMARGGRPIYAGPRDQLFRALGMNSYADIMDLLEDGKRQGEVSALADDFQRGEMADLAAREAERAAQRQTADEDHLAHRIWRFTRRFLRQFPVMVQRQIHLLIARGSTKVRRDRGFFESLFTPIRAGLPLLTASGGAAIVAGVAKSEGLGPGPSAAGALGLLTTVCIFASQAMTQTDIVNEFATIRRERRTGALTAAVVLSKWLVFAGVAVAQAALITLVFVSIRPGPTQGNVLAPTTELFVNLAGLTVAAMTLGLFISAIAKKVELAVLINALVMIGEIALNGASTDLSGSPVGNAFAVLLPTRWGLAAAASSMDLTNISPTAPRDALWTHSIGQWTTNLTGLGILTVLFLAATLYGLRRRLSHPD